MRLTGMILMGIALYLTAGVALAMYENSHAETAFNDDWDYLMYAVCAVLWPLWLYAIVEDAARDWQMKRKKTHGE